MTRETELRGLKYFVACIYFLFPSKCTSWFDKTTEKLTVSAYTLWIPMRDSFTSPTQGTVCPYFPISDIKRAIRDCLHWDRLQGQARLKLVPVLPGDKVCCQSVLLQTQTLMLVTFSLYNIFDWKTGPKSAFSGYIMYLHSPHFFIF